MADSVVMDTVAVPVITTTPLTAEDRCDKCGARASVRAVIKGHELLFCKHHGDKYMGVLVGTTTDIYVQPVDA